MNPIFKLFVKLQVWLYQSSNGKRGSMMQGRQILLLTTTGSKTGKQRTVPVVPFREGDQIYVMASMAGAPEHPAWFKNLRAKPDVEVQLGADKWKARAEIVPEGPERDRLWKAITTDMPNFGAYQTKTTRVIPVVRLVRAS
ncbi:MAG TPA: nitroreductase family deazaflavin-dependent oxidoreductase [Polyangiaceae bacterium]